MIDFHSHILPNIDDGSRSIEETFNLINEAKSVGFEGIISTSHYMENSYEVPNKKRNACIDDLKCKINEQDIKIDLYIGSEIYITDNIVNLLKQAKAASINNSRYVLFELPRDFKPMNLNNVIYNMIKYNLIPVLAHPERYNFVKQDPLCISELIQKGVMMQSNFGSFIGQYGKEAQFAAKKLLKADMIHFLGSDVHRQNTIYYEIPKILKKLTKLVGEKKVEELTKINPRLALNDEEIKI